jgi:hypothetical protein
MREGTWARHHRAVRGTTLRRPTHEPTHESTHPPTNPPNHAPRPTPPRVVCLGCGTRSPRHMLQEALAGINPAAAAHAAQLAARPAGADPAAERLQALRVGSARDDLRVVSHGPWPGRWGAAEFFH